VQVLTKNNPSAENAAKTVMVLSIYAIASLPERYTAGKYQGNDLTDESGYKTP